MARRFLVSRLSSLGDVVCCLPAAAAIKAGEPDAHVTWVVDPRFADVVRACGAVDAVVSAKPSFRLESFPTFDGSFDVGIDLQGLLKSATATLRAKVAWRVGYHWQREGSGLFSRRVLPDVSSLHVVDQYVDVARAIGGVADRADFALAPSTESLQSIGAKLRAMAVPERFVAINPGAGWTSKRWPASNLASVIDGLAKQSLSAVLIGGGSDEDRRIADEVEGFCSERPFRMTGQTSIAELIALISLASVHLGGDTGSTHLAAALGVPAVGLYSTTRPSRSCPYGQVERCFRDPRGLAFIESGPVLARLLEAAA